MQVLAVLVMETVCVCLFKERSPLHQDIQLCGL